MAWIITPLGDALLRPIHLVGKTGLPTERLTNPGLKLNAMGHEVPTMIGVDQSGVSDKVRKLVPDYMVMGDTGGSMGGMKMPIPSNTLLMMGGEGAYGDVEMGGMFTMVKIREGLAQDDYRDPGWFTPPAGTQARVWSGPLSRSTKPGSVGQEPHAC